jgi:hypothetical protein
MEPVVISRRKRTLSANSISKRRFQELQSRLDWSQRCMRPSWSDNDRLMFTDGTRSSLASNNSAATSERSWQPRSATRGHAGELSELTNDEISGVRMDVAAPLSAIPKPTLKPQTHYARQSPISEYFIAPMKSVVSCNNEMEYLFLVLTFYRHDLAMNAAP